MARSKDTETDNIQDINVFPDGYEMNAWNNNDGRSVDISASRSRATDKRPSPNQHQFLLYFPKEEIPEGWQYSYMTERLLGEPQLDNLQEQYEKGWDFVNQSDHPTYTVRTLYPSTDNRIRRRNCILMKMPMDQYLEMQRGRTEESAAKQREISALTDYLGTGNANDPRFVVENSGSYTPSYSNRRG
jgi:hypothetical protein